MVLRFKAPKTCHVHPQGALVSYRDYVKIEKKLASYRPEWQSPDLIPDIPVGTESEYWIAIYNDKTCKVVVFLANYQNRPLTYDDNGDLISDDYLVNADGDPHESIGWVTNKSHHEFDDFYEPIVFSDDYRLLGWAEYEPPIYPHFGEKN